MLNGKWLTIALAGTILLSAPISAFAVTPSTGRPMAIAQSIEAAATNGSFDGRHLYAEAFAALRNTHLTLVDTVARDKWAAEWEHKHDATGLLDTEEGTDKAILQMTHSLGQRFDHYRGRSAQAATEQVRESSLSGIGTVIGFSEKQAKDISERETVSAARPIFIRETIEGGPAEKVLRKGDQVLAIDGKSLDGLTLEQVSERIRGAEGSAITITVRRQKEQLDFSVTRARIVFHPVKVKSLGHGITYMRLDNFMSKLAPGEFVEGLMQANEGEGLIIDLRGNGGGLLVYADFMASLLMFDGTLHIIDSRSGDQLNKQIKTLTPTSMVTQRSTDVPGKWSIEPDKRVPLAYSVYKPIVVLVNGDSYSASEILSGALKHAGRATIVGEPTGGKGVGQTVIDLPYGRGLDVISFRFRPGGDDIDWVGLIPDVQVSDNEKTEADEQLDAAKAVLRQLISKKEQLAKQQDSLRQQREREFEKRKQSWK
jgi:C-terminal peptidase prc